MAKSVQFCSLFSIIFDARCGFPALKSLAAPGTKGNRVAVCLIATPSTRDIAYHHQVD
jgi:hypothetical protein